MAVTLNHTIVHASDPAATARWLTDLLDLPPPVTLGYFTIVQVGETSLDYLPGEGKVNPRHFAFLVSEAEFDAIFARLQASGAPWWSDPGHREPGRINLYLLAVAGDGSQEVFRREVDFVQAEFARRFGTAGRSVVLDVILAR